LSFDDVRPAKVDGIRGKGAFGREFLINDLLSREGIAGELIAEFDRLTLEMRDVPSAAAAVKRLVHWLENERRRSFGGGWRLCAELLRGHEIGRLLRTDPMVRRCQWRPAVANVYDLVEPFVWGWDDAIEAVIEADQPGQTVNSVFLAMGVAAAMRERRAMVHAYLSAAARGGASAAVLGLGAGRSPETALAAPDGPLDIGQWIAVDPAAGEDAVVRRQKSSRIDRRTMPLLDFLETRLGTESFDLVYMIDALDGLDDGAAATLVEKAARVIRPNGRLVLSAFAPDLAEAAYMDAVLDWRPVLRGEGELDALLKSIAVDGRMSIATWRGGSERAVFGMLERLSWAA
jgi:SAM-dependent methyltransferase